MEQGIHHHFHNIANRSTPRRMVSKRARRSFKQEYTRKRMDVCY